jgi:hypothetical protein
MGTVLVCSSDADAAAESVAFHFDLPRSQTVFDVVRIKPSIFQMDRHSVFKKETAASLNQQRDPLAKFECEVVATVRAASEAHALRRLGQALVQRSGSQKALVDKAIGDLEVNCQRRDFIPRSPAVEQNGIYKSTRFFSGGAARGK